MVPCCLSFRRRRLAPAPRAMSRSNRLEKAREQRTGLSLVGPFFRPNDLAALICDGHRVDSSSQHPLGRPSKQVAARGPGDSEKSSDVGHGSAEFLVGGDHGDASGCHDLGLLRSRLDGFDSNARVGGDDVEKESQVAGPRLADRCSGTDNRILYECRGGLNQPRRSGLNRCTVPFAQIRPTRVFVIAAEERSLTVLLVAQRRQDKVVKGLSPARGGGEPTEAQPELDIDPRRRLAKADIGAMAGPIAIARILDDTGSDGVVVDIGNEARYRLRQIFPPSSSLSHVPASTVRASMKWGAANRGGPSYISSIRSASSRR